MKLKTILVLLMVSALPLLSACSSDNDNDDHDLKVSDIESIQAYTDQIFYGEGLISVDVTYKSGVDVSEVTPATYILEDRGAENPDFRTLVIDEVVVNGQVVTLYMNTDTGATENNVLIYTGANDEGSREKVATSVYVAEGWYRDPDGNIHYGSEDSDDYLANTVGLGYYARECLELKLRHSGEPDTASANLANEYGEYYSEGLWRQTIDANLNTDGFISFSDAGIYVPSTSATSLDGDADPYVRGWVHIPASYDESGVAVPLIITISGNGTSFWLLPDGSNNFGTGLLFDGSGLRWKDSGAIVLNIHDRSELGGGGDDYDFVLDDVNTIKYFLDNYNIDPTQITLTGNSRGTAASNQIIRALAGLQYSTNQALATPTPPDKTLDKDIYDFTIGAYVCNNGALLKNIFAPYDDADTALPAIAATGLRFWANDGEQDSNNVESLMALQQAYSDYGWSDEWIADNMHLSAYPSEIFYYWGVSDHNMTRTLYYYFFDTNYYGPDVDVVDGELVYATQLEAGETYTLQFRGNAPTYPDYEYLVYPETIKEWVLNP